jgi:hypothetical protein
LRSPVQLFGTQARRLLLLLILPAAARADAANLLVTGWVGAGSGVPAGARVELLPLSGHDPSPQPAAAAPVDGSGSFRLAAPRAGMWRVVARAPGFLAMELRLTPLLEDVRLAPVELRRDDGLRVSFTGPRGDRPPGGTAVANSAPGDPFWRDDALHGWYPESRRAEAGPDGAVRLPRAAGERLLVRAQAPGCVPSPPLQAAGGERAVSIPLASGRPALVEVRAEDGKPLAGVRVRLQGGISPEGLSKTDGRLQVTLPIRGRARLVAEAGDGRRGELEVAAPGSGAPLVIKLSPPVRVSGKVTASQPIPGALVWSTEDPAVVSVAGPAGEWTLEVPAGQEGKLTAVAPGFLAQELPLRRQPVLFTLRPAGAVSGTVVDPAGRPVARAEVRCVPRSRPALPLSDWTPEAGLFRLRGLDPGQPCELSATKTGYLPARSAVASLPPGGERKDLRLVLHKGRRAFGQIVESDGLPVAGAEALLLPLPAGALLRAAADANGRFEIPDLPPGSYRLVARHDGYAPAISTLAQTQAKEIDLGVITLTAGAELGGVVQDKAGHPIAGAEVTVEGSDPLLPVMAQLAGEPLRRTTDATGGFTFEDLQPGKAVDLAVERAGYSRAARHAVAVPPEEPVNVTLSAAVTVSGRATDRSGQPVEQARVALRAAGEAAEHTATTDGDGRFRLADVAPGRASLSATAPGYGPAEIRGLTVPERGLNGVELVLAPEATVEGQVTGPDGAPVDGATVTAAGSAGTPATATTGGDGHYRLAGLDPDTVRVTATHPEFAPASRQADLKPGENEVDLSFEDGFAVDGGVSDPERKPVPGAHVTLTPLDKARPGLQADSGEDGSFSFPHVPPGSYRLSGEKEGFAPAVLPSEVRVATKEITGLRLELSAGGSIAGRLIGLSDEEIARLDLSAVNPRVGRRSGRVEAGKRFRFDHLPSGAWYVLASVGTDGRRATGKTTLDPSVSEVSLDLTFAGDLTLTGRALLGGGPAAGLTVLLSGLRSGGSTQSDSTGSFRFTGLEASTYRLTLLDPQRGLRHGETVEISADRDLVIELPTGVVTGTAVGPEGTPLAGVAVTLEPVGAGEAAPAPVTFTDSSGHFGFSGVAAGAYRLVARRAGLTATELPVVVGPGSGALPLQLVLRRTG